MRHKELISAISICFVYQSKDKLLRETNIFSLYNEKKEKRVYPRWDEIEHHYLGPVWSLELFAYLKTTRVDLVRIDLITSTL